MPRPTRAVPTDLQEPSGRFENGSAIPSLPIVDFQTMRDVVSQAYAPYRATLLLIATFAGIAVLLAAVGVYSLVSYSVSQRTHEIGIRISLGAGPGQVLRLVMIHGLLIASTGIGAGLIASYWFNRLIRSRLYGVSENDPFTIAAVAMLLLFVSLVASYFPARRAVGLDPVAALRHD